VGATSQIKLYCEHAAVCVEAETKVPFTLQVLSTGFLPRKVIDYIIQIQLSGINPFTVIQLTSETFTSLLSVFFVLSADVVALSASTVFMAVTRTEIILKFYCFRRSTQSWCACRHN